MPLFVFLMSIRLGLMLVAQEGVFNHNLTIEQTRSVYSCQGIL
uniref:Uncharacterized protein n=1 Tax=Myoviridae sp. ctwmI4 TaxID=2826710 RepID=A0A8S5LU78_9CAUD|nr:MAG TPA: hypothetical protein [Myoviridae sp. ctwmI4]